MSKALDKYQIRPRKRHDGFNLEGERISHHALWYRSISDAISYAEWNSRVNGCQIEILDSQGKILTTEEFSSGDFVY